MIIDILKLLRAYQINSITVNKNTRLGVFCRLITVKLSLKLIRMY
jgi:hypothetical protein